MKKCKQDGCDYPSFSKGWCKYHHMREYPEKYKIVQSRTIIKRSEPLKSVKGTKTSLKGRKSAVPTESKQELDKWFEYQLSVAPDRCEECGVSLSGTKNWIPRAAVAHILPKRKTYGFPSVATHPMNRMFYCIDCHTNMDNGKGSSFKSLPVIKERLSQFMGELTEAEKSRLPEWLTR